MKGDEELNPIADVLGYITTSYVAWIFTAFTALVAFLYTKLNVLVREAVERNNAAIEGVRAMLRIEIIEKYNRYKEKGYFPIYARDNIRDLYKVYKSLGGNGTVDDLMEKLSRMETDEQKKEEVDEK